MSSFQEIGNRLIKIAEHAQAFRQYNRVREAAQVLTNIPIKRYQAIGHYYIGLCEYRAGKSPKEIFEQVAEEAPAKYRVLALQSLSIIESRKQDYASELYWLMESLKVLPSVESLRGIAIVKAKEGYHQSAVKDLEKLYPLLKHVDPLTYFQYLNSLAVELGEVGRINEARAACSIALASPFAPAYLEWTETHDELEAKSTSATPSVITFSQAPEAKPASRPKPEENAAQIKAIAFGWLLGNQIFQRAMTSIAASTAIVSNQPTQTTLDRLGKSIRARAPPANS